MISENHHRPCLNCSLATNGNTSSIQCRHYPGSGQEVVAETKPLNYNHPRTEDRPSISTAEVPILAAYCTRGGKVDQQPYYNQQVHPDHWYTERQNNKTATEQLICSIQHFYPARFHFRQHDSDAQQSTFIALIVCVHGTAHTMIAIVPPTSQSRSSRLLERCRQRFSEFHEQKQRTKGHAHTKKVSIHILIEKKRL